MTKVLFKSYNLLGDSLQTTPVIKTFKDTYQDVDISVGTDDNYISVVYERLGFPVHTLKMKKEELPEDEFDFVWEFDIGKAFKLSITHNVPAAVAFGALLGMRIKNPLPIYKVPESEEGFVDQLLYSRTPEKEHIQPYVLFQPYSVSCSSWSGLPANKRWPDERWVEMYNRITADFGLEVLVLGGKQDQKNYLISGIPMFNHLFGLKLDTVAELQKRAALVLTLDSGVAHLAASQEAKMLEFYPSILPSNWMSNMSNPNGRIIYSRPEDLSVNYVWQFVQEELELVKEEETCTTE